MQVNKIWQFENKIFMTVDHNQKKYKFEIIDGKFICEIKKDNKIIKQEAREDSKIELSKQAILFFKNLDLSSRYKNDRKDGTIANGSLTKEARRNSYLLNNFFANAHLLGTRKLKEIQEQMGVTLCWIFSNINLKKIFN